MILIWVKIFYRHGPKSIGNKANIDKWDNIKMHPHSQKKKWSEMSRQSYRMIKIF